MSKDCPICGHDSRTPCITCLKAENERLKLKLAALVCRMRNLVVEGEGFLAEEVES